MPCRRLGYALIFLAVLTGCPPVGPDPGTDGGDGATLVDASVDASTLTDGAGAHDATAADTAVLPDGNAAPDASPAPDVAMLDIGAVMDHWDGPDAGPRLDASAASDLAAADVTAPDTIAPDTIAPDTSQPDTATFDSSAPDTSQADTVTFDSSAPDTSVPDTATFDSSAPDTNAPDTFAPDTAMPDTFIPDAAMPDTAPVPDAAGCGPGYDTVDGGCLLVDECLAGTFTCPASRVCQKSGDTYSCPCGPGYVGGEFMCSKLVTSSSACVALANYTDVGNGLYACVCRPGYPGGGTAAEPCEYSGFNLRWEQTQTTAYMGECVDGFTLVKLEQGVTPLPFDGETIAVGGLAEVFLGAGCSGSTVTSVVADPGVMAVEFSGIPHTAGPYMAITASHPLLGTGYGSLAVANGPATALAIRNATATPITTACNAGQVAMLKGDGSDATENAAVSVVLSSTAGHTRFAAAAGCAGATTTLSRTIAAGSSTVPFYWKSAAGAVAADTLTASDGATVLTAATHDVTYGVPVPAGIAFGSSYYNFEDTAVGQCHSISIKVVDAAGATIATPTTLLVNLQSDDSKVSFYTASGCGGYTTSVTVPANGTSVTLYASASAFYNHPLTATSDLGSASTTFYVADHCAHTCYPAGHPTCGSCSKCCSGTCGTNCR